MFIYARSEQCDVIGGPTYLAVLHDFGVIFSCFYSEYLRKMP